MEQQTLTTRIVNYVEKSTRPTKTAPAYGRLLRNTIFGIRPVTSRVHDHVETLIQLAQHRAECDDRHNCTLMIDHAVKSMRGHDYHDIQHDHGERRFW